MPRFYLSTWVRGPRPDHRHRRLETLPSSDDLGRSHCRASSPHLPTLETRHTTFYIHVPRKLENLSSRPYGPDGSVDRPHAHGTTTATNHISQVTLRRGSCSRNVNALSSSYRVKALPSFQERSNVSEQKKNDAQWETAAAAPARLLAHLSSSILQSTLSSVC